MSEISCCSDVGVCDLFLFGVDDVCECELDGVHAVHEVHDMLFFVLLLLCLTFKCFLKTMKTKQQSPIFSYHC